MASSTFPSLEPFKVGRIPSIFYLPNYVTLEEEELLLSQVYGAPSVKWKTVTNRRLQNWVIIFTPVTLLANLPLAQMQRIAGGIVHEKGLISQPLPGWLRSLTERLDRDIGLFPSPINHVLVNEYGPGQGIMAHQDGPLYYPVVAIVSLGASAVMNFTAHPRFRSQFENSTLDPFSSVKSVACDHSHNSVLVRGNNENERNSHSRKKQGTEVEERTQSGNSFYIEGPERRLDLVNNETFTYKDEEKTQDLRREDQRFLEQKNCLDEMVRLEPRSLLIFCEHAYTDYLHGIEQIPFPNDQTKVPAGTEDNDGQDKMVKKKQPADFGSHLITVENDSKELSQATRVSFTCRVVNKAKRGFLRL